MRNMRSDRPMTTPDHSESGSKRATHRRDISARQDLLGKELRQLFDDYTREDVPDELMRLAMQLQGAMASKGPADAEPVETHEDASTDKTEGK